MSCLLFIWFYISKKKNCLFLFWATIETFTILKYQQNFFTNFDQDRKNKKE